MAVYDDRGEIYIGDELREFMKAIGVNQYQVAKVLGISQPKVSNILNNETPVTREIVMKITDAYKKTIIWDAYAETDRRFFNDHLLFGSA